jgi:hypothetical protein
MSVRESIAKNIVTTLKAVYSPLRIGYITREPFDFEKLSSAQFPAILVRTADENREDSTVGGTIGKRQATISYELVCFVKAGVIDTARNSIIEAVEEGLDADRTRGGFALDTQITNIEIDEGSIDPFGGVILNARVLYEYTRGTT